MIQSILLNKMKHAGPESSGYMMKHSVSYNSPTSGIYIAMQTASSLILLKNVTYHYVNY